MEKLKELADKMYSSAQYLSTDASRLRKAMKDYHDFVTYEYPKVKKDLTLTWEDVAKIITIYEAGIDNGDYCRYNEAEWMKKYSQDILKRFNEQRKK